MHATRSCYLMYDYLGASYYVDLSTIEDCATTTLKVKYSNLKYQFFFLNDYNKKYFEIKGLNLISIVHLMVLYTIAMIYFLTFYILLMKFRTP